MTHVSYQIVILNSLVWCKCPFGSYHIILKTKFLFLSWPVNEIQNKNGGLILYISSAAHGSKFNCGFELFWLVVPLLPQRAGVVYVWRRQRLRRRRPCRWLRRRRVGRPSDFVLAGLDNQILLSLQLLLLRRLPSHISNGKRILISNPMMFPELTCYFYRPVVYICDVFLFCFDPLVLLATVGHILDPASVRSRTLSMYIYIPIPPHFFV